MKKICDELNSEYNDLDSIVSGLNESRWDDITPFFDWSIRDGISHLAFFDKAARLSATDENAFKEFNEQMYEGITCIDDVFRKVRDIGRNMTVDQLLTWWREERSEIIKAFLPMDSKARIPWYGPSMSVRSSATARLMETWAHGQDIADHLKINREPTNRLRNVAHICLSTFAWSFTVREMPVPDTPVRVELECPDGELWARGPENASNIVRGKIDEFCLVVTKRRHLKDTGLITEGPVATEWMSIAQAFAGTAEQGPGPGERLVVYS